jgi:uncharacterized protein YggE
MPKNEEAEAGMRYPPYPMRRGMMMMVAAAFLIMLGMIGGAYLLSKANFAPVMNVNGGPTNPNIYVSSIPPDHAISTSATVTQQVAPDLLVIQVSVKTEGANAKKSQQDNAVVSADLLSKVKALGLADQDIQTSSYSVDPIYNSSYVCDKMSGVCGYNNEITGYRTTNSLTLNVKDLSKGGDIIDAASTAGTNQTFVDSVSFTLQDATQSAIAKALLKNASTEAKDEAQNIASGLGVSLGKVLSASQNSVYYPSPINYRSLSMEAGAAAPAPSTQLSAGQVEVSATVSTSFEVSQ